MLNAKTNKKRFRSYNQSRKKSKRRSIQRQVGGKYQLDTKVILNPLFQLGTKSKGQNVYGLRLNV